MTDIVSAPSTDTPDHLAHVADTSKAADVHRAGEVKHTVRKVLGLVLRILLCLVFGLPLLFMVVSSLKPDIQIFSDLGSIAAFLPVGELSFDNYIGAAERVPLAQFMINSVIITVCTVGFGLIVNSMAAFALARLQFRGQKVSPGHHPGHPDRALRNHGAAAAVVGEHPPVRRRERDLPGLAGQLPGPDRALRRQRVLNLPLLPVLRLHPEGTGRGGQSRRGRLVPDLPQHRHAPGRACRGHRRHPDLPPGLEPVPVAADGRAVRGTASGHGGSTTSSS